MPKVQLVREGRERRGEEERQEGEAGDWKGRNSLAFFFSFFFFRFFPWEMERGKPVEVQGCGAVVKGRSGASLLLSFLLLY